MASANFLFDDAGSPNGTSIGSAAISGGNIRTLEGLENGTYTVFITKDNVTDPNEGCETFATFTIGLDQPTFSVDLSDVTQVITQNNQNCDTPNGSIQLLGVEVDGTFMSASNAKYFCRLDVY